MPCDNRARSRSDALRAPAKLRAATSRLSLCLLVLWAAGCDDASPSPPPIAESGSNLMLFDDAFATAREVARREGFFGGQTSGANVFVARRLAAELGPGRRVLTLLIDSGLKYLAGDLYGSR